MERKRGVEVWEVSLLNIIVSEQASTVGERG